MFNLIEFYHAMSLSDLRNKYVIYARYIPVRIHLVLLLTALFLGSGWVQKNNALPETARTAIINVFIIVTFWFALGILILSFLSAFIPWLIFLFQTRDNKQHIRLQTPGVAIGNSQKVLIDLFPILKPPFGFIRLRLFYDSAHLSPRFSLVRNEATRSFFSRHLKGVYKWPLSHIKEYDIRGGIIYFEDFFQFFSFAVQLSSPGNFYTQPLRAALPSILVEPKKTRDMDVRIEELRKLEGEFINYKNFEHNDDVRRIVWKIYARNKELVVRIPEIMDNRASHIYFYASFFDSIGSRLYEDFNIFFLDQYKTAIWNVFEQLYRVNDLIQYIPDQETKTFYTDDPLQKVKYIISTSSWQQSNDLASYFQAPYASVLCVSSMTEINELAEILEKSGHKLVVIFVRLSKSFAFAGTSHWLKWIFVKPENKSIEKLQLLFVLSPLRNKLISNENAIEKLLKQSDCEALMIDADTLS
jgi:uncharacterized membrane protein